MKRIVVLLIAVIAISTASYGQDYKTAIGLRGGFTQGLTYKQFLGGKSAVEGILATRYRGFAVTGLYELHTWNAFDVSHLNWFYGVGGHVGFFDGSYTTWNDPGDAYIAIGVDAILGLEYNFQEIPINISIDWKPAFNIIGYTGFWGDGGAVSIRYLLDR